MLTLKVSELLEAKGKSRYWLAQQCNTSDGNMAKICNGETVRISFDMLELICRALECTPNDIIISNDPQVLRLLTYECQIRKVEKFKGDTE